MKILYLDLYDTYLLPCFLMWKRLNRIVVRITQNSKSQSTNHVAWYIVDTHQMLTSLFSFKSGSLEKMFEWAGNCASDDRGQKLSWIFSGPHLWMLNFSTFLCVTSLSPQWHSWEDSLGIWCSHCLGTGGSGFWHPLCSPCLFIVHTPWDFNHHVCMVDPSNVRAWSSSSTDTAKAPVVRWGFYAKN